jgi:hypothetical protein
VGNREGIEVGRREGTSVGVRVGAVGIELGSTVG